MAEFGIAGNVAWSVFKYSITKCSVAGVVEFCKEKQSEAGRSEVKQAKQLKIKMKRRNKNEEKSRTSKGGNTRIRN